MDAVLARCTSGQQFRQPLYVVAAALPPRPAQAGASMAALRWNNAAGQGAKVVPPAEMEIGALQASGEAVHLTDQLHVPGVCMDTQTQLRLGA